ncbi:MAG: patatin-like protein [Actinomycetota bacterium]|nr:patatin-like protein [Actinomycetota bacterium]
MSERTVEAPARDLKELRLGLVCYGGVSLAIYMHGITKEIQRAVRASVLEEQGIDSDPDAASERAYRELLRDLAAKRKVQTRIVVDAIAGSSAGGINGIFLAKALAHNVGQEALRDLWFEHGDLEPIIRKGSRLARILTWRLPLGGGVPTTGARRKLAAAALGIHKNTLLYGHQMANWIYEALEGMDPAQPQMPPTLMPQGHPLELSVTVTDHYGYKRDLPIADPPVISERQHRHLVIFRYGVDGADDFGPEENAAMTLAARATSSLPAGFPPVSIPKMAETLPQGATTPEKLSRFFRTYELAGADPTWAYLVDGGVLDNKPFGPVIQAIRQRHAANEVDRYLLFLEPDPGATGTPKQAPPEPAPLKAVLGALSGLPRNEPILDELHDVLVANERVRAVRDVIEANWEQIARLVQSLVPDLDQPPDDPGAPELRQWSDAVHRAAQGLGYTTYLRLKIGSTLDSFASAACLVCDYTDASNQAFLVRAVVREWARRRGLFAREENATQQQLDFLRDFDLGYAERRLRFVIAGVSWLYGDAEAERTPSRKELDAVKQRLYEAVAKLERLRSGTGFADDVLGGVKACFGEQRMTEYFQKHGFDINSFLEDHGDELNQFNATLRTFLDAELRDFTKELYRDLVSLTKNWNTPIRRDLLIRYFAFPIWDALLYPVQALSDVAERDEVRVARLSPLDSKLLPVAGPKVQGADLGHAYAFFSREARENDYLWGRLDAAERLVGLLLTTAETPGVDHPDYRARCKEVFRAVLDEDAAHLPTIQKTVADLRAKVEAL